MSSKAKPVKIASFPDMGREAWASFDVGLDAWVVNSKPDGSGVEIGEADSIAEARSMAREYFEELMA